MTAHKFWLRALSGGLLAQFDWLASVMVAGGSQADREPQRTDTRRTDGERK